MLHRPEREHSQRFAGAAGPRPPPDPGVGARLQGAVAGAEIYEL